MLSLYSVMGRPLPHRRALLREVFPLQFLRLSRFPTLLIGFALIISSINIHKRKKRAFHRWFLDSLNLMTITAFGYAGWPLFRPVIYQFRTLPRECHLARNIVVHYGRSSLDFFKLWPDKSYFFSPSYRSFLAYRVVLDLPRLALALGKISELRS